jgi:hypothetical protein
MCALTFALVVVGLGLHLSAGSLTGASVTARDVLASAVVGIAAKLAIAVALVAILLAGQRSHWRWIAGLFVVAALTVFIGPLSALTQSGATLYFVLPIAGALLAWAYTNRIGDLGPARRIGDNGRIAR